uniref:Chitin-binding type-2 domain-containing protein n=1 Tax=Timema shepardi TaxID=629360 RepID=A0A7R9FVR7_TIMSH|nr:unnamed protein product [Timema shepardi]
MKESKGWTLSSPTPSILEGPSPSVFSAEGSGFTPPVSRQTVEDNLGLPSNATSIRADITDTFSCEGRTYGYYADTDNGCQLFHVCLPVVLSSGKEQTYKWSFICPEETIFNQESFTCARPEDSVACEESPQYYSLNDNFGKTDRPSVDAPAVTDPPQELV